VISAADPLHFDAVVAAPFGGVGIRVSKGTVAELIYLPPSIPLLAPQHDLARAAAAQLAAYFDDPGFRFSLPLAQRGTEFQRRVWQAISTVPAGATVTYGALARQVRSAPRAVGQACGANWFPLVVPCHRVLAAGGIGGFANHGGDGFHLDVKRWLLRHERVPGHA
jgi:methylated-DNA-[protein]-cysteine S-methyltransferase